MSADVLTELQAEFEGSRKKPHEQSHADAVRDFAIELAMPMEKVDAGLAALEAQPKVVRKALMRWIAEAWGRLVKFGSGIDQRGADDYKTNQTISRPILGATTARFLECAPRETRHYR